MSEKKGKIIEEFVNAVFTLASIFILFAFFASVVLENTGLSLILLLMATVCGCIKMSYNDEMEIEEE